jgi:hypothetical protein
MKMTTKKKSAIKTLVPAKPLKAEAKKKRHRDEELPDSAPFTNDHFIGEMRKSVKPQKFPEDLEATTKSKVIFGTRRTQASYGAIEVKGFKRLNDQELREVSIVDPYISAIISKRAAQVTSIGRPSESKFDKGTRIRELRALTLKDFNSKEEFEQAKNIRNEQAKSILDWIMHCGTKEPELINLVYVNADADFKTCNLYQFLQAQTRNLLTFGRCATQIIRDQSGLAIMFRPVPVETIYRVFDGEVPTLSSGDDTHTQSESDLKAYTELKHAQRPVAYVQRVDGADVNFFTQDDLVIWNYQSQALFDLNSYPLAPIELAVYMVYVHQQTLTYLRNQFVKGMASKGMLVLESTSPSAQLSEDDIEDFRQQFHNFVTRTDNSNVIPVIGGPVKANFIPLNQSPRDLEFLHLEEHIVRALCSAFQISPMEMGYGNLGLSAQGGMTQAGKQTEIVYGEETGLRMLLDVIYDGLNAIVFDHFREGKEVFAISYSGVGEDTREAIVSRNVNELNTTATMNSLWCDSDRTDPFPFAGDAPLCPHFNQFVAKNMMYWEYRKYFLADKEAENNPAYDFIIDSNMNQVYQQLKITPVQDQQAQSQMQLAMTAQQAQMQQQQMEQPQDGGQPAAEGGQQPKEELKQSESLRDIYKKNSKQAVEPMHKSSMESLFESWLRVNLE